MTLIDNLAAQVRSYKDHNGTLPTVLRISPDMLNLLMHEARPYFSGCQMRFYPSQYPLGLTVDMVDAEGLAEVTHDVDFLASGAADSFLERALAESPSKVLSAMFHYMTYWTVYLAETRHDVKQWWRFQDTFNKRLAARGSNYRMLTE